LAPSSASERLAEGPPSPPPSAIGIAGFALFIDLAVRRTHIARCVTGIGTDFDIGDSRFVGGNTGVPDAIFIEITQRRGGHNRTNVSNGTVFGIGDGRFVGDHAGVPVAIFIKISRR
jgi:hypothetical protein